MYFICKYVQKCTYQPFSERLENENRKKDFRKNVISFIYPLEFHNFSKMLINLSIYIYVTDNRLGINSCHAISRLYQATLMICGTAKHVSVDCTIYIYIYIYIYMCVCVCVCVFTNYACNS